MKTADRPDPVMQWMTTGKSSVEGWSFDVARWQNWTACANCNNDTGDEGVPRKGHALYINCITRR